LLGCCVPDEFQSDMQRLGTNPARIGGKSAHTIHEKLNARTNAVVNIKSNENPHNHASVVSRPA
jgi:hypothetical protein